MKIVNANEKIETILPKSQLKLHAYNEHFNFFKKIFEAFI